MRISDWSSDVCSSDLAAAFDAADDRSRGDADILEDHVADPRARLAHLLLDLSDLNALGIGGHEEGADLGVLGAAFPRRSPPHKKTSGEPRDGNAPLRSAPPIVVTNAPGACGESCAVPAP